jgi:hypothetical protein
MEPPILRNIRQEELARIRSLRRSNPANAESLSRRSGEGEEKIPLQVCRHVNTSCALDIVEQVFTWFISIAKLHSDCSSMYRPNRGRSR